MGLFDAQHEEVRGSLSKWQEQGKVTRFVTDGPSSWPSTINKNRVLAIDADPAVGLSTALGIEVKKTVDDIRGDLVSRLEKGDFEDKAPDSLAVDAAKKCLSMLALPGLHVGT